MYQRIGQPAATCSVCNRQATILNFTRFFHPASTSFRKQGVFRYLPSAYIEMVGRETLAYVAWTLLYIFTHAHTHRHTYTFHCTTNQGQLYFVQHFPVQCGLIWITTTINSILDGAISGGMVFYFVAFKEAKIHSLHSIRVIEWMMVDPSVDVLDWC